MARRQRNLTPPQSRDDPELEAVVIDLRSGWATLSAAEKAEWASKAAMVRNARSDE
jgi:hypothetical protein